MALSLAVSDEHRPFVARATLRTGIGMDMPYGIDLAGVLASRMRAIDRASMMERTQRHQDADLPDSTEEVPEDMNLPLATCHTGTDWHWLASCAIPIDPNPDPEARTFYRVVDTGLMQRAAIRPLPYHHPAKGSFRNLMASAPIIVCREVEWRGVGDVEAVRRLLAPIAHIGRRRKVGEGRVLSWSVEAVEGVDPGPWVHADADVVLRPVPEQCLDALGVPHSPCRYAIRPPSWNPERMTELAGTTESDDDWEEEW